MKTRTAESLLSDAISSGIIFEDAESDYDYSLTTEFSSIASKTPQFLNPAAQADVGIMHAVDNFFTARGQKVKRKRCWHLSLIVLTIIQHSLKSNGYAEIPLRRRE